MVSKGLIDRTMEERQNDIKKGIYKEINSQIRKIDLESQTSSRIVVLVELNYLERLVKNSGEFINETSLNPCLLYTSPSPRDGLLSRMPSSA